MHKQPCPFCPAPVDRLFFENELVAGFWDAFPVSSGHALLVPRRHVATWFEAAPDEWHALSDALAVAKCEIEKTHNPDGYNVGINCGAAAGQTVFHLHVHLIPRYHGDIEDPRGGVRHVLPRHANYLAPESDPASRPVVESTG